MNTDSKGNLRSLYFTADAMRSNRSDVAETLFQNQGCVVHMLSRLLLALKDGKGSVQLNGNVSVLLNGHVSVQLNGNVSVQLNGNVSVQLNGNVSVLLKGM